MPRIFFRTQSRLISCRARVALLLLSPGQRGSGFVEELPFPLRITADGTTAAQSSPSLHSIPSLIPFGTTHYGPTSPRLESLGVKARGSELRGGRSVGRREGLTARCRPRVRCQSVSHSSTVRVRCRTTRAPSEVMRSLIPMPMRRVASSPWAGRNRTTDTAVVRSLDP